MWLAILRSNGLTGAATRTHSSPSSVTATPCATVSALSKRGFVSKPSVVRPGGATCVGMTTEDVSSTMLLNAGAFLLLVTIVMVMVMGDVISFWNTK